MLQLLKSESIHRLAVITFCTLGLAFLSAVAGALTLGLVTYKSYADQLVPPDEMAINRPSAGAKIFDRDGKLLYQYVDDTDGLRLLTRLEDISPAFLAATIATEDSSFFDNPGINPRGLARAVHQNFSLSLLKGRDPDKQGSGGSSITQQLVKNVYIPTDQRQERSIERKLREIVYSVELTKRYDKAQILEWYVNQISYGGIYTGIEAASEGYFGKHASELTLAEAATLAGIPQSPAAYDPVSNPEAAASRRNEVLDLMSRHSAIRIGEDIDFVPNAEEVAAAREATVEAQAPNFPLEAPHFVLTYVVPKLEQLVGKDALLHDGLSITTSIDLDLQNQVALILDSTVGRNENQTNSHNGAVIVFRPGTGEILAMAGSRDYYNEEIDGQVNVLLGLRSPGSSFKPFVYLTAFSRLGWTPGTIIEDSPIIYHELNGSTFQPQNPTKNTYAGNISVRRSLGNSLNIPAFKTALQLGSEEIVKQARNMGFTGLNDYYGPSISIGGISLHGLDLAYGYTALANGGVLAGQTSFAPEKTNESLIQPVAILKIADNFGNVVYNVEDHMAEKRVAAAEYTYMVTDILSDPQSVCATFGCGGLNVPGYRVAVKTGTSEPYVGTTGQYGDTWAFGYTPDYVVGVWSGNSDYQPVSNIFSTTIAFPVMRDVMLKAYAGQPGKPIARPTNLVYKTNCALVSKFPKDVKAPGAKPLPPFPTSTSCTSDLAVR